MPGQQIKMAAYSELDILQLYRDAFFNHKERLLQLLQEGQWTILLTKTNALSKEECATIEASNRNKGWKSRRKDTAADILDRITEKNNVHSYLGFSRVVYERNSVVAKEIFPFVEELEKAGMHPPLTKTDQFRPHSRQPTVVTKPVILWLSLNDKDFKYIVETLLPQSVSTALHDMCKAYMVELCDGSVTLYMVHPSQHSGRIIRDIFNSFSQPPHLAVMTGSCQPTSANSVSSPGEVVMVTRSTPRAIMGEVQFMIELWKLRQETEVCVRFGAASKLDDDCFVKSPEAVDFYLTAQKIPKMEYLAAVEVRGSEERPLEHQAALVMHKIVEYFSDNRL